LTALDIESGKPLWKNAIALGGTQDVNYTVYGDKVLFNGFRVHGVAELESGKVVWQVKVPKIKRIGNALPLADGDTVCFLLRREVKKFNIADGKLIWSCKLPASGQAFGGMMLDGRKLIVNYVNRIFVIDADTGKIKAKSVMAAPSEKEGRWYQLLSNSSEPVSVGGDAVVGGDDGAIYKIDTATAKLTEIFRTGFAFKGRPFVSGNRMVIVGFDGIVYAIEL
jgi:outer membrane protein assembly factor BamB